MGTKRPFNSEPNIVDDDNNNINTNSITIDVYTIYFILPSNEYNVKYKQYSKHYNKEGLCYDINKILKKRFEEKKNIYKDQLSYFEEAEEENSFRRTELRRLIDSLFVLYDFETIIQLYKNNDALFYNNERLYYYYHHRQYSAPN